MPLGALDTTTPLEQLLHKAHRQSTAVDAEQMLPALREAVTSVDPAQPSRVLVPMTQIMSDSIAIRRFLTIVLGVSFLAMAAWILFAAMV